MTQLWSNTYSFDTAANNNAAAFRNNNYVFIGSNGTIKVRDLIVNNSIGSVLDYGCGYSNSLQTYCGNTVTVAKYDAFISDYSTRPANTYDLVVSHLMLHFAEKDYIPAIVQDICNYSNKMVLLNIIVKSNAQLLNTAPWYNSNTSPKTQVYFDSITSANLTIVDAKVSTAEERISLAGNTISNDVITEIRTANVNMLCILAKK
jgi:hypothetical protein